MKSVFIAWLLLPVFAAAQDCKLNSSTDPFTKETKLSTGFMFFSGGSLTIDADSKEVDFLFSLEGSNACFDNNSAAIVYFEGTKVKLNIRNAGTMNCEGLFHFIYKNAAATTAQLQKLSTQKVSQIVFTTSAKKEMTMVLTPADQELLIRLGTCLVTEAKTLLR